MLPPLTGDGLSSSCRLLDTRLLDEERSPVGALQLTSPGYLDCLVRILRPDVVATVEIDLWRERRRVFTATSRPLTSHQPATFAAGVQIPADFLNEQAYRARFRLNVRPIADAEATPLTVADESLEFSAMNPHPARSVWNDWPWNRNGVVSPRLVWNVSYEQ